jgi:carboxyl-terminal processing protease
MSVRPQLLRRLPRFLAACLLGIALATSLLAGCAPAGDPGAGFAGPEAADFSQLSWSAAFQKLNDKLAREYAFTDWKGFDWAARYAAYRPRIAQAEAAGDRKAYYLALREYVFALEDGHASFSGDDLGLTQALYGGGFGLILARLDDGRVAVTWLKEGGPAATAGIRPGAEITAWDGKPVLQALAGTSALFGDIAPTRARLEHEKLRFLARAPVGAERKVAYRNPGEKEAGAVLKAADDKLETLRRTDLGSLLARGIVPERVIEAKMLPGNVGYISIFGEFDLPPAMKGDHTPTLVQFRAAVEDFIGRGVKGIILDVRGNTGGSDAMSAAFLGSFYQARTLYERQTWFNALTGKLEYRLQDEATDRYLAGDGALYIEPQAKQFTGPVIALVDNGCVSSGEGVAMGVGNLNNGRVVGFQGTRGAFGMVGDRVVMPGGYVIGFPWGQSLDRSGTVQLDSRYGAGGVMPNMRVPLTLENAVRAANGQDMPLEYALQAVSEMYRGGYR